MEHRRAPHRDLVAAIDAAAGDDFDRRLHRFHGPDLHVRCVRAQQQPIDVDEERVLRVAGGMVGREVQRFEVVPVGLDLRTRIDRVAHLAEDVLHLPAHERDGMQMSEPRHARGKRDVDDVRRFFTRRLFGRHARGLFLELRLDAVAKLVQRVAELLLLFLRDILQLCEKSGDQSTLAAEVTNAEIVEGAAISRVAERSLEVFGGFF